MIEGYVGGARANLEEVGFGAKSVAELMLPPIQHVDAHDGTSTAFQVYGDPNEAHTLVFTTNSYGNALEDDLPQQVRLAAQFAELGAGYCLVGTQLYHPKNQRLVGSQAQVIKKGSFLPFAERFMPVIEKIDPKEDQKVVLVGHSKAGDDMTEVAYQMTKNPNFDGYRVDSIGVFDPGRSKRRNAFRVVSALANAAPNLYQHILASNSVAILESRGIDTSDPKAEKKYQASITKGVLKYFASDISGNYAQMMGFRHETTTKQLVELHRGADAPEILAIRLTEAEVCTNYFVKTLRSVGVTVVEYPSDHSGVDQLEVIAGFTRATTELGRQVS